MAQTDPEVPLSEEQIEEPKKYTRSKRENTEETLDALLNHCKTAESKRELEIMQNEKCTLELEILEKKLQLQRIINGSPEVYQIPPVKLTLLHGCFEEPPRFQYARNPGGGTLKIFDGGVPFVGFQGQPALENLAEKDTQL